MQHLILITILLLVAGLLYTVKKWPGGLHMTFSQHVAAKRSSKVFYSLLFIAILPMLTIFISEWLVPTKGLPDSFLWITLIAVTFQILSTWFPEEGGRKTTIHRILTGISGIALLPLMFILATASSLSGFVRISAWFAMILMLALLTIALSRQKGYRYALLLQVGYYSLFFGIILLTTYT